MRVGLDLMLILVCHYVLGNSIWYLPSLPNDEMSRISSLEAAARAKAVERIASLIQRPDQLEKVILKLIN